LGEEIKKGDFREDFYYRINAANILPHLRERVEDIPLLIEHFVGIYNKKLQKTITGISSEVMEQIMTYPWPGNVRELENVIERATLLSLHLKVSHLSRRPPGFLKKGSLSRH
jgi:transcriptional regulator with PAS, ATPase and Fis domain